MKRHICRTSVRFFRARAPFVLESKRSQNMKLMSAILTGAAALGIVLMQRAKPPVETTNAPFNSNSMTNFQKPSEAELKKKLSSMQFKVTQEAATEPPFKNDFWDNHAAGIYVDIVSGKPLFSSLDKFDSGCGWPSFTKPIESKEVVEKRDTTFGMIRTEVRSQT